MDPGCLGIVSVPLRLLHFDLHTRLDGEASHKRHVRYDRMLRLDKQRIRQLAAVFRRGQCHPARPQHQVVATIAPDHFAYVLQSLQTTQQGLLEKNAANTFPTVAGTQPLLCSQGRRRIEAAKLVFGDEKLWVVRLYPASHTYAGEEYLHEAAYSDGYVYRRVRQGMADAGEVYRWKQRTSAPKRKNIEALLRRDRPIAHESITSVHGPGPTSHADVAHSGDSLCAAFDALMPFTGLWNGLQLGNMHKHLALHCDEQISAFLRFVARTWEAIFGQHTALREQLDVDTAKFLQYKAPLPGTDDREQITRAMDARQIFPLVSDPLVRADLLRNILSLQVVIPSIETFHENMKYFSIGAKILQDHIEVAPEGAEARGSLFENLRRHWTKPQASPAFETGPGKFEAVPGVMTPTLAFAIVFLIALRHFPYLSEARPLVGKGRKGPRMKACVHPSHLKHLTDVARWVGFKNAKTMQMIQAPPLAYEGLDDGGLVPSWRGGIPFTATFKELQHVSLLDAIRDISEPRATPLLVLNNISRGFFGPTELSGQETDAQPQRIAPDVTIANEGLPDSWAGRADEAMPDFQPVGQKAPLVRRTSRHRKKRRGHIFTRGKRNQPGSPQGGDQVPQALDTMPPAPVPPASGEETAPLSGAADIRPERRSIQVPIAHTFSPNLSNAPKNRLKRRPAKILPDRITLLQKSQQVPELVRKRKEAPDEYSMAVRQDPSATKDRAYSKARRWEENVQAQQHEDQGEDQLYNPAWKQDEFLRNYFLAGKQMANSTGRASQSTSTLARDIGQTPGIHKESQASSLRIPDRGDQRRSVQRALPFPGSSLGHTPRADDHVNPLTSPASPLPIPEAQFRTIAGYEENAGSVATQSTHAPADTSRGTLQTPIPVVSQTRGDYNPFEDEL